MSTAAHTDTSTAEICHRFLQVPTDGRSLGSGASVQEARLRQKDLCVTTCSSRDPQSSAGPQAGRWGCSQRARHHQAPGTAARFPWATAGPPWKDRETATEGQHEALCRVCALPTTPGLLLLLARPSAWQLLIKQSPPLPPTQRRRK